MVVVTASGSSASTGSSASVERALIGAVVVMVGLLGLLGMVNSYTRVASAVAPSFGALAWTVPVGIDVGIGVLTALDLVFARLEMRVSWLRLVVWLLVGATVYLNVADERTPVGVVAHAVLPGLWVIAVEAAGHAARVGSGLAVNASRGLDRVRWSRWLLAPLATARLWRRMVLWEVRSYPEALRRERDRVLARCDLVDRYGCVSWRWKAPRRQRALYRLGDLAPSRALADPAPEKQSALPMAVRSPASARTSRPAPADSVEDLVDAARRVAAERTGGGRALTRRELVDGLRALGHPVGNARAGMLLARLRSDQLERLGLAR